MKKCLWPGACFRTVPAAAVVSLALSTPAMAQCVHVQNVSSTITGQAPYDGRMIYHAATGKMVSLVEDRIDESHGGWVYDGTGWTALPDPPFQVRITFAWIYDSTRNVGLLFGAPDFPADALPELWAYDGNQWRQLTWTGPSPPEIGGGPWGAFDPNRGRAIFFYEGTGPSTDFQTWEWTGSGWEQGPSFSTLNPPDDFIFDAAHNVGFVTGEDPVQNEEVWYYRPGITAADGSWERQTLPGNPVTALSGATLAYDPYRQRILRCCGHYAQRVGHPEDIYHSYQGVDIWDFGQTNWDRATEYSLPDPNDERAGALAAYDLNRDLLVLAGGIWFQPDSDNQPKPIYFHDTWESSTDEPGIVSSSSGSQSDCLGGTAVFSVTPAGSVYQIQWFHNGNAISGAVNPILALHNLTTDDAGNYVAQVYNDCGYLNTPKTHLRVDPPTTLFRQALFPNCSQTCIGNTITINPPLPVYTGVDLNTHLQKNIGSFEFVKWVDVRVDTPAAPANFIFTNVDESFSGDYRFYIDGSACPGIVASAINHIQVGFQITSQPQSLSNVRPCSTITFSFITSGGCGLTYRWFSSVYGYLSDNGHFIGTHTPVLTIDGVHYDDEGTYQCVVVDTAQCNNSLGTSPASLKLTMPQWVLRTTSGPPSRRANAMVYDSARGVSVLYGGGLLVPNVGYRGFGEVWEWDGSRWRQRTTYNWTNAWHQDSQGYWRPNYGDTPAARMQHAMAYDSRRGRVVMFGGRGGPDGIYGDYQFDDTWEWDGTRWYFCTTNGPSSRFDHHMGYDPVRGVTVLYGGAGATESALWEWNGTNWTSIYPTNGPSVSPYTSYAQDDACLVFDTDSQTLFAGAMTDGSFVDRYFTWDGHDWYERSPGFLYYNYLTPAYGNMVYDTYRHRSLRFGGQYNYNASYGSSYAGYYDPATDSWSALAGDLNDLRLQEIVTSLFAPTDFLNVTNLIAKLSAQSDPVSQYLWSEFATTDQQTLTNSGVSPDQKQNTLAGALNNLITNNVVYDPTRFAAVPLSTETAVFRNVNPAVEDIVRFNRLLLEDAYPADIARSLSTPTGRMQFGMAFDSGRRCAVVMGGLYGGNWDLNPLNGSDTWELMYLDTPLINVQPASQYRAAGDTAAFNVNAVAPYGSTLSYQWYSGAVPLTDGGRISGAHSPTLRIANVNAGDAGQYQALISAACGSMYSVPAILTTDPSLQIFSAQQGAAQLVWAAANLVLEQADQLSGPWSAVPGASSPFDLTLSGAGKFFRLNTNSPAGP